jgi:hypothetical protein
VDRGHPLPTLISQAQLAQLANAKAAHAVITMVMTDYPRLRLRVDPVAVAEITARHKL